MQQTKTMTTMINFAQTYQLMKNYLSKKRFSYVYEQCIKYYNKNQAFFTNHEILMLIKLIFYILKKKMIAKIDPSQKNFSKDSIQQIFTVMMNVYLSWQSVLNVQMNAQNPQFFQMLFRTQGYVKKSILSRPQNLLFQAKKDYIIPEKVNVQYKIYNFFKQCLRMIINSLMVMFFNLDMNLLKRMTSMIQIGESIMIKFNESQFPIQRAQFYLLKCQVYQFLQQKCQCCPIFKIKYQFPIGLFQLIHNNLYKWKQPRLIHNIKLLLKIIFFSIKIKLIQIKDAYILASEIKLLIHCIKRKQPQSERRLSHKARRGIIDLNSTMFSKAQQKNVSGTSPLRTNQRRQTTSQIKTKGKYLSILKLILTEIQTYIDSRREIQFIARIYMREIYNSYKSNQNQGSDEIIDEIPMLIEKQASKPRKYNSNSPTKKDQNKIFNLPFLKLNSKSNSLYASKKENYHEEEHSHEMGNQLYSQSTKIKDNKIILRNIVNIKQKKKLTLTSKNEKPNNWQRFEGKKESSRSTQYSAKQQQDQSSIKKFPFQQFFKQITQKTFKQIPALKCNKELLCQKIPFLEQSSSDSQNQMQYDFQIKRRSQINELNNKFYKKSNPNYNFKSQSLQNGTENNLADSSAKRNWISEDNSEYNQNDNADNLNNSINLIQKNKKISDDIEFQEIKLLDEVIQDRIFNFLNLELDTFTSLKNQSYTSQKQSNSDKSNQKQKHGMILQYSDVIKKTQNLKNQVNQLNRQRKLLCDNFNYKSSTIKMGQKYNPKQQQRDLNYHSILKDLQNLYNTKNNLTDKAIKCVNLYRKLLRIDDQRINSSIFNQAVEKYSKIYKKYGEYLPIIGETQEEFEKTNRRQEEIPIIQYIVQNRPISILQERLKIKQLQHKFDHRKNKSSDKKQIALRETFDNLRGNISKVQFNENNSLTKNFVLKAQISK